jgi:hypothetical protein
MKFVALSGSAHTMTSKKILALLSLIDIPLLAGIFGPLLAY